MINYRYDDALDCENSMSLFSENSKIQLNRQKSGGIAIFSQRSAEMKTVNFFDFLSYRFLPDKIQPSPKSIAAIKRRCSRIIYNNLLLYPRRVNAVSIHRFGTGFIDWDLVTCINELRRYIYSRRPQHEIDRVLLGEFSIRNMGGPVSYFCLVPDGTVFRELDGWLSDVVHRAYKKRLSLVRSLSVECPTKEVSKKSLLDGSWYKYESLPQEAKLPSFFTAWRVARLSWSRHGLGGVDPRGMVYAYSLQ